MQRSGFRSRRAPALDAADEDEKAPTILVRDLIVARPLPVREAQAAQNAVNFKRFRPVCGRTDRLSPTG